MRMKERLIRLGCNESNPIHSSKGWRCRQARDTLQASSMTERFQSVANGAGTNQGSPPPAPSRFLGRQPILDQAGQLYGYELLFRASTENHFSGDVEEASREVIDHWLMLNPGPNEGFAFVNCTRAVLAEGVAKLLPARSTVLEILETVDPDPELLKICADLRQQGYRFALDDFSPDPARAAFMEIADFVKVDFLASDAHARREIYAMAASTRPRMLAEKIESDEEMRVAKSEGCSLFQGYFFSRPVIVASRPLPQNHLVYLRLLAELNEVPTNLKKIENLVQTDASLCYRVLRLANSAMYGLSRPVSTVRSALVMVGEDAVRRMVTVAITSALAAHRSSALVSMALVRARFCELLAPSLSAPAPQLYLLGMLSLLDVLLEMPIDRVLESLPIDEEMKAALRGDPHPFGPVLELVRCLESCDWQKCESARQSLGVSESAIATMYLEALHWAPHALH